MKQTESLEKEIARLNDRITDMVRDMSYTKSFFRGLVTGLGSVIGATVVVAVIVWILSNLELVPIIGVWLADIVRVVQQNLDVPSVYR